MLNLRSVLSLALLIAAPMGTLGVSLAASIVPAQEPTEAVKDGFDHSHGKLTAVLEEVLEDGLVDYAALRKTPAPLNAYLAQLEATTPAQHAKWTRDERYAFWINAYNAYTLKLIRDKGPVKSIKKLGGLFSSPWEIKFINLGAFDPEGKGHKLMLDEIEHDILRPTYKDGRVHAAVNCASMGCPPLRAEAYRAKDLQEQLDDQVALWLADTARNRVTPKGGKIYVSKIFDWFDKDFGKKDEKVVRWIADHVDDEALAAALRKGAESLKVKYLDYDWGVNAQKGKR